jgi:hypothetical protein
VVVDRDTGGGSLAPERLDPIVEAVEVDRDDGSPLERVSS